jgi:hypothetical protein
MKLAILCGGKSQLDIEEPLQGIKNSLSAVSAVLHENGWQVVPEFIAATEKEFKETIKKYIKDNHIDTSTIKNILFFYTGHGIYGNSYSQEAFNMIWEEQNIDVERIVGLLNENLNIQEHKTKVGLIIDACYSGDILKERSRDEQIELLTSTQEGEKTFEKSFDGIVRSIFSYIFTKIFELPNQNEIITIRSIKKIIDHIGDIESLKDISNELKVYYGESLDIDSIVIGNNKEVNAIRSIIKQHYKSNPTRLKKDFLSYHLLDAISFPVISNCNDFDTLLEYLFTESECLYCILKKIDSTNSYLKKLKIVDCEDRQTEDKLRKIIFLVGTNTEYDGSKKYDIESYYVTNKKRIRPVKTIKNVDFNIENKYREVICDSIVDIKKQIVSSETVEIIFVLPNDLHNIEFSKIKCSFGELRFEYDIFIQSQIRYMHIDYDRIHDYIARWKKNSAKYISRQSKTISDEYLYTINSNTKHMSFGKQYIREESNYVCLVSTISLISYIEAIINFGLPIVVFPLNNSCEMISTGFKIGALKHNILEYISSNGDEHYFMYDLYDEVKELKEQITQIQSQVQYI